jgi:hypothetical protein
MNSKQQRIIIISGTVVLIAIFALLFFFSTRPSEEVKGSYTTDEYIDPASGEQVIDTKGKTPENGGSEIYTPTYFGMDALYSRGFSQDDVSAVRTFLNLYTTQQLESGKQKIEKISLEKDTIQHGIDRTTGTSIYTLHLLINLTTAYTLTVTATDANQVTYALYLGSSAEGTPVFSQ